MEKTAHRERVLLSSEVPQNSSARPHRAKGQNPHAGLGYEQSELHKNIHYAIPYYGKGK